MNRDPYLNGERRISLRAFIVLLVSVEKREET
jgi:hypothetical protein